MAIEVEEVAFTSGSNIGAVAITLLLFIVTNAVAYGLQKAFNYNQEFNRLVAGIMMLFMYYLIRETGGVEDTRPIARFGLVEILIGVLDAISTFIKVPQLVDPEGTA